MRKKALRVATVDCPLSRCLANADTTSGFLSRAAASACTRSCARQMAHVQACFKRSHLTNLTWKLAMSLLVQPVAASSRLAQQRGRPPWLRFERRGPLSKSVGVCLCVGLLMREARGARGTARGLANAGRCRRACLSLSHTYQTWNVIGNSQL